MSTATISASPYTSTTNACKLCTPLGATLVFKGIEGGLPYLHGSQGCATYMRRYIISHFREPMDIASSALGEKQAIYGGGPNLKKGLLNVMQKYSPSVIGVASTCLTETIGDDVPMYLHEFSKEFSDLDLPHVVHVATPSYMGTHMEGFHKAVLATVQQLVPDTPPETDAAANASQTPHIGLFPGLVSPEDLRHLRDICTDFCLHPVILPDYSETLDGTAKEAYEPIPSGGTTLEDIRSLRTSCANVEFGRVLNGLCHPETQRDNTAPDAPDNAASSPKGAKKPAARKPLTSAATDLQTRFGTCAHAIGLPIGLRESDAFFNTLSDISNRPMPSRYQNARGRLIDAMVDGHKYLFGKRVVLYGEEDLVVGLASFSAEIGLHPVLVATGARQVRLQEHIAAVCGNLVPELPQVREGVDFHDIAEQAADLKPDLVIGHSKGYRYARDWNVPLVRVGFPVHDRIGGQRLLHLGYHGAQQLFDRIVNALLEKKQADNPTGWGYL